MRDSALEIQTERLVLRPFRPEDVDDVLSYAVDEQFGRLLINMPDHEYTRLDAEAFLGRTAPSPNDTNADFAVVLDGHVIGGVDLSITAEQHIAELGYAIAKQHWGRGLAPEAAAALIDWGFDRCDIAKVFASANAENVRSQKVMEKLGMRRAALLRQHRRFRGRQVDEVIYSVLRDEWLARQPSAVR